jgi:hypothetical protein
LLHHLDELVIPTAGETAMRIHLQEPLLTAPQLHHLCASPAGAFTVSPCYVQDAETSIAFVRKCHLVGGVLPADPESQTRGLVCLA